MTLRVAPRRLVSLLAFILLSAQLALLPLRAQPAATGTITGRVLNPATREYVRNAEVSVSGTSLVAVSGDGGTYTLTRVPPGEVTVTVSYTGYTTAPARVTVGAGAVATRDFDLTSTALAPPSLGETVKLDQFIVSSEREGNAKAIMEQKRNLNISTSVASDVFGDVAQGNVGEFLKYLPGVDVEYQSGVARSPMLGGLDPQYVGVAVDGAKLASADAFVAYGNTDNGTAGGATRSVGFEAMVLSGIESIEISRTLSAEMDADAPAGRINMKTKRAFDRKGRRVSYQVGMGINSEEFTLQKTPGPEDHDSRKVTPNFQFGYSESFLNNRLGFLFHVSQARNYLHSDAMSTTFNRTATAADPRPLVLSSITFQAGSNFDSNFGTTATIDYKVTPRFVVGLGFVYNAYESRWRQPVLSFTSSTNNTAATTGRSTVIGDGITTVQTGGGAANTSRTLNHTGGAASKNTRTSTYTPQFEYTAGALQLKGTGSYSKSFNDYEALEKGFTRVVTVNAVNGDWIATRPSATSYEWTIRQLSGADWQDLSNYKNPRMNGEGRSVLDEIYNGQLDGRYKLPFGPATLLKFGGKINEQVRKSENTTPYQVWAYNGPEGGATGSWGFLPSPRKFSLGSMGTPIITNMPVLPNYDAIGTLFNSHPELFANLATAENYYSAYIANKRDMLQRVTAGYGMAETRLGQLQLHGGLRWEQTITQSKEWDPLTADQVAAAGYPVSPTTRRATTIPGMQYQYQSQPRTTREGDYADWFPSLGAKYSFTRALSLQVGYNRAISRPPINALSGVWVVNDVALTVSAPNPGLLPEESDNVVARLAYYFEPVGSFTFQLSQNEIANIAESHEYTAEEFGYGDDPEWANYTFISTTNSIDRIVRFRSMEFGYNQALSFLPGVLRATNVSLAYTRLYSNARRPGRVPHRASANLAWTYHRYNLRVGGVWSDDTSWTNTYGRWRPAEFKLDLSGGYRLSKNASLYFQARNLTNKPLLVYDGPVEFVGGATSRFINAGVLWQFGVKGEF